MHMLFTAIARRWHALLPLVAVPVLAGCAAVAMGSPVIAQQATPAPTAASGGSAPLPTPAPTAKPQEGGVFYWYVLDSTGKPSRALACVNQPSGDSWVCQQRDGEKVYFSPAVPLMVSSEPIQ